MSTLLKNTISTIKHWWVFLLTGMLLIAGSVYVLYTPEESYVTLSWLFSILITANGLTSIIFSISNRKQISGWGWYLTGGILELIFGIFLIAYPVMTMIIFPIYTGFWLLFRGFQTIGFSLDLKEYGLIDWGWMLLIGAGITTFATLMLLFPLFGFLNVIYLSSFALFLIGVANISFSMSLKKIKTKTIDKVDKVKKAVKKEMKALRKEVVETYANASEEDKKRVDAAFKTYESQLKSC